MARGHPVSITLSSHASPGGRPRLGFSLGKFEILFVQHFFTLDYVGMRNDALDGTHFDALRPLEMADTFGAEFGIYFVELDALIDRAVRAFRLADIAVDTLIGDQKGHVIF